MNTSNDLDADLADDFEPAPLPQDDETSDEEEPPFRGRAGVVATRAGQAAKEAGTHLMKLSSAAAQGLGALYRTVGTKVVEVRERRAQPKAVRRTAPPPAGVLSADGRRLRPQPSALRPQAKAAAQEEGAESAKPRPSPSSSKKARRVAALGAGAALLGTVLLIALNRPAAPPGAEPTASQSVTVAAREPAATGDTGAVPQAKVERLKSPPPAGSVLTADVPLFGPTPMATLEPAPLEAPPAPSANLPELGAAPEEDGLPASKLALVPDEVFEAPPAEPEGPKAEDVKPWGRGKVNTPTLHRLRLDGPGTGIQGAITATGFSLLIPGRKVMESGEAITKRDKRIARVSTKNSAQGAQVSFSFKSGIPGYRVRLRRDFVEFLVSAPDKE